MNMEHGTVIIGNGIAGITAARHLRKHSKGRIQVISAESPYFFSRTALMYVYMGHMKFEHIQPYENWFWEKNRIELVVATVLSIDPEAKSLSLNTGETLPYDKLVIATGSATNYYNWPGQDLKGVLGLYSKQDLELLETLGPAPSEKDSNTKHAVIVGAGLIGVELAEMLHTRGVHITILVREEVFWGNVLTRQEGKLIGEHLAARGIDLRFKTNLKAIKPDQNGRVSHVETEAGERIDCQIVGITTGVKANIAWLGDLPIEKDKGILVDEYLETSIPGIYAAGDCAQVRNPLEGRRPLEPVWYVGRMMGEALGRTLAGQRTAYKPGPWFNSAKFFDLEYQTYGIVKPVADETQTHYFWKMPDKEKFMTVAYHPESGKFIGVNTFGIRLRHEYFDLALRQGWQVGEVIGGMKKANFDPEFYKSWYSILVADFEKTTGITTSRKLILTNLFR